MTVTIHTGDCQKVLRTLSPGSAHTCVTSPPYFGLRDYGVPASRWPRISYAPMAGMRNVRVPAMSCALGLEPTPEAFIAHLVHVFRAVRDVLRDDGTLWLNLGDTYAANGVPGQSNLAALGVKFRGGGKKRDTVTKPRKEIPRGLKAKDLMGMPWRVALALQADGWYLRQDIIWSKPNPMPESVRDRCTKAHEYLFLLSKSERYYFDQSAISEELEASSVTRLSQDVANQEGSYRVPGKANGPMHAVGGSRRNSFARETKASAGEHGQKPQHRIDREDIDYVGRRNRRSVWTVATQPFKEAHFATFPPDLIEPCIAAGAPPGGVVLDTFGGSGTTGETAEKLGRDSVLIELNPSYAAMADRRTLQRGLVLKDAAA